MSPSPHFPPGYVYKELAFLEPPLWGIETCRLKAEKLNKAWFLVPQALSVLPLAGEHRKAASYGLGPKDPD